MKQAAFERHVGVKNICPSIHDALQRAGLVYCELHADAAETSAQEILITNSE
jgi:hypothetical protein